MNRENETEILDELPYPDPAKTVDDERCYYRKDEYLIESALTGTNKACCVYFGLRRYGKTCFLKRIDRVCKMGLRGFSPQEYRTELLYAAASPRENTDKLQRILASVKKGRGLIRTAVMIDDLQELDKHMERSPEAVKDFAAQVAFLFEMASEKKNNLRLILCEPTNFGDWLSDQTKGAGGLFSGLLLNFALPVQDSILPPFTEEETGRLLRATVNETPRVPDVEDGLVRQLWSTFGGNPWLLSYAHRYVREGRKTRASFREVAAFVTLEILNGENEQKLGTIYGSLNKHERFFVRMVLDLSRGHKLTEHCINERPDICLTNAGYLIASALPKLGIVTGQVGHGFKLIPILSDYLNNELKSYDTFKGGHPEDHELWYDLLTVDRPNPNRGGSFIIHQVSDLLLDSESSDSGPWKAYLEHIERLKNGAENPEEDCRPDLIILCGNTIGLPAGDEDEGGLSPELYMKALRDVQCELKKLVPYLRPEGNEVEATAKQILILPGIFDLDWTRADAQHFRKQTYAKDWRDVFQDFSLAGERWESTAFSLDILPFDTTSLKGAFEHGGTDAVENLAAIRARLQNEFIKDYSYLCNCAQSPSDEAGRLTFYKAARRLLRLTMSYVVGLHEHDELGGILNPTFKYRDSQSEIRTSEENVEPESFVADSGFINPDERVWLSGAKVHESAKRSSNRKLTIAVTHHHPHLRRRGGVIEFYDGHDFRQQLVSAGIQFVLHGHSAYQQVLSEKVTFKDSVTRNNTSSTIELIGSGSFSSAIGLGDVSVSALQTQATEAPSFNRIVLTRNPASQEEPPQVSVEFMEWDSKQDKIIVRGTPISVRVS
jgi:hypothetical protein